MCDELIHPGLVEDRRFSRRTFGLAAAGALTSGAALAGIGVAERDVEIKTADGSADGVLFHPEGQGAWPAVLIWVDIMGLRPAFREMGKRLAAQGYVVLVPNPYYRTKRGAPIDGPVDFSNPEQRKLLFGLMGALTPGVTQRDSEAFLAFLDAQPQTDCSKKAGVQGYCMGGGLSIRTAAAAPSRIGAVATFHGGNGMASDAPDRPHLLLPNTKARYLMCLARNDDAQQPLVKDRLKAAFAQAHLEASVEVYPADHGWCVPGGQTYDASSAERAWSALSALYKSRLA